MKSAKTVYTIKDKFGKVYTHGTVGTHHIPIGNLYSLGSIDMTLEGIDTPQKLNLEVRIEGSDAVNDWDFWVIRHKWNWYKEQYIPPTPWMPRHWQCYKTEEMC